jgi:hypothetical protein
MNIRTNGINKDPDPHSGLGPLSTSRFDCLLDCSGDWIIGATVRDRLVRMRRQDVTSVVADLIIAKSAANALSTGSALLSGVGEQGRFIPSGRCRKSGSRKISKTARRRYDEAAHCRRPHDKGYPPPITCQRTPARGIAPGRAIGDVHGHKSVGTLVSRATAYLLYWSAIVRVGVDRQLAASRMRSTISGLARVETSPGS